MTLVTSDWKDIFSWRYVSPEWTKSFNTKEHISLSQQEIDESTELFMEQVWMICDGWNPNLDT